MTDFAEALAAVAGDHITGIVTRPVEPTPPMTWAEMRRIAEEFAARPPIPDRLVVAPDVQLLLTIQHSAPIVTDLIGLRIVVDETLPPGCWEIRARDVVVKRIVPAPWPGEMIIIDGAVLRAATEIKPPWAHRIGGTHARP
ncbi:hypothetical protein ABT369_38770 [Dactylosporangium sp. NPDC000244]|uniref:hypothetical protein n=1 Tax=Dactylosporangium sp. NPDC000244 TaxID=3154365 RepID=UPI00332E0A85